MPLPPGTRLGPYEIVSPIGRGGQGEVYRAHDTRLGRDVAIKIVAQGKNTTLSSTARFDREWRAIAKLSHANVVSLYDVGTETDVSYAVMELLEGQSLDALIATGALPWKRALDIGIGVANGLAAAHDKEIVHRDLKPANVFITADGSVKVLDFGLARSTIAHSDAATVAADTESLDTTPGTVMGTVGYMSPEQVKGQDVDHRSDIFSFGCILYEMLTGQRAFKGHTSAETMAAILRDEPKALSDSGQHIPIGIAPIIRRCLEKRPEERFQSARDLAFGLKALLESSGTTALAGDLPPAPRPASWRNAIAAVAVVLVAIVGYAFWPPHAPRIRSIAVLPLVNQSGNADQDYLADGITDQLITNLGNVANLRVISRTSSMTYKGTTLRLPQIADELGVDAVVEGAVARDGSRLKLSARLMDAKTEARLWQDTFDRDVGDALVLQGEIAEQIARKIAVELNPDEVARLQSAKKIDPEAFDAYVRGRYYLNKRTQTDFDRAIAAFSRAIDVEPTYAAAYAGLSDTYSLIGYQNYLAPSDAFPKARAAAMRAIELDSNLAAAYAALGYVNLYHDWDFTSAETNFKHALSIDPHLVSAHHYYSILLAALLRAQEAREQIALARSLDPLSTNVAADMGFVLYYDRRYPEAAAALQEAIAANKAGPLAHMWLARTYQAQGRYDDSVREFKATGEGFLQLPIMLAGYGHLQAVSGRTAEATKTLAQLQAQRATHYVPAYCDALVYLGLKDYPRMKTALGQAIDERSNWPVWLLRDPRWDPVRGDPEFERQVDRMGFPADARQRAAAARAGT
jgi:TolB-like protein/Tfp pilus assembly protein PilF